MSQYLFLLLVLACPLMMIFMMRGHGHGREAGNQAGHTGCGRGGDHAQATVDELRRDRDELDRRIAEREAQAETSGDRSAELV